MNIFDRSAIAIFCDDVRVEKSEQKSIVGAYSFQLEVDEFPHSFSKLCVYSQFVYATDKPISEFSLKVYQEDALLVEHPAPDGFIESSRTRNLAEDRPSSALFAMVELVGLEIDEPCTFFAIAEVDGVNYEASRLKIFLKRKAIKRVKKKEIVDTAGQHSIEQ